MLVQTELSLAAEIDRLGAPPAPAYLTFHVPGVIRGKARAARKVLPGGRVRTFVDEKTANAETWVRACAIDQIGQPMFAGPIELSIRVIVPIAQSWSKKKQAAARSGELRPTGKPDFDNTSKLLCDALNKIAWLDDSQVVDSHFSKIYGDEPGALIGIRPVGISPASAEETHGVKADERAPSRAAQGTGPRQGLHGGRVQRGLAHARKRSAGAFRF